MKNNPQPPTESWEEPKYSGWHCPHGDMQIMNATQTMIDEHLKIHQPLTESWETEFDNAFYFRDSGSYVKCYPELNLQQLTCLKLFISRLLSQAEARHREELEELKLDFREQLTRLED